MNVMSCSARFPMPGEAVYSATKGFVDSLAKAQAKELPPKYGSTFNAVSSGPTRIERLNEAPPELHTRVKPFIASTPAAKRPAETGVIAYVIAMLCEDGARWINGNHIMVSGGLYMS